MSDALNTPAPAPKKKSKVLIIVLLLVGLFIGLPCVCCIGGAVFFGANFDKVLILGTVNDQTVSNSQLSERLGDPYEKDAVATVNINGSSATADVTFTGPNGSAKIHAELSKASGNWEITSMVATFDDGSTADLMNDDYQEASQHVTSGYKHMVFNDLQKKPV